jgi:hypothetical protein
VHFDPNQDSEHTNMGKSIGDSAFIEKKQWRSGQQKQLAVLSSIADIQVDWGLSVWPLTVYPLALTHLFVAA